MFIWILLYDKSAFLHLYRVIGFFVGNVDTRKLSVESWTFPASVFDSRVYINLKPNVVSA